MVELDKILIATRGECARRIAGTVKKLGKTPVIIFTEDDKESLHVKEAVEAHKIPSYTDIGSIVKAALKSEANAIHPGYGFASENPNFPKACEKAGIKFIGPSEDAMRKAGNKENVKRTAKKLGVPIIDSSSRVKKSNIVDWATKHGLSDEPDSVPVMLKAAKSGGGSGNKVVFYLRDLEKETTKLEESTQKRWGKSRIFAERIVRNARHIEVQLLGDEHGNLIHLGSRDCTVQYGNQKVIEEAPASFLTLEQETLLQDYALAIGRAIGYSSTGTTEFLVSPNGDIFFMEFNPRLQVEHGVTELITNQDLVKMQILIARGEQLQFKQEDINFDGVAIEARVNSQTIDPNNPYKLMPALGVVKEVTFPEGRNVRVDHSLYNGYEINPNYNPTHAKVMTWSPSREEAIEAERTALEGFKIEGAKTNTSLLLIALSHPRFLAGTHTTTFFNEMLEDMAKAGAIGVAVALALQEKQRQEEVVVFQKYNPWQQAGRFDQTRSRLNVRGRR